VLSIARIGAQREIPVSGYWNESPVIARYPLGVVAKLRIAPAMPTYRY